jgi:hypothetical protein
MPQRKSPLSGMILSRFELERSWAALQGEELEMTSTTDNSFPYVLICSRFGTIVSLATVWIETAQSFAPLVGA